jgi:hypothetical protein
MKNEKPRKPIKRTSFLTYQQKLTKAKEAQAERVAMEQAGFLMKTSPKLPKKPEPIKRTPLARTSPLVAKKSLRSSTTLNKKSKSPKAKAKEDAWAAFSLYIRTRDSLLTTGSLRQCVCVTCGRKRPRLGKGCIQAGHFLAGRTGAVLFSEIGVNGQCYGCNIGKGGHYVEYTLYMVERYGKPIVDQLILDSKKTLQYKEYEYREIEQLYKDKTEMLLK